MIKFKYNYTNNFTCAFFYTSCAISIIIIIIRRIRIIVVPKARLTSLSIVMGVVHIMPLMQQQLPL
jgi:hypothetical protein